MCYVTVKNVHPFAFKPLQESIQALRSKSGQTLGLSATDWEPFIGQVAKEIASVLSFHSDTINCWVALAVPIPAVHLSLSVCCSWMHDCVQNGVC